MKVSKYLSSVHQCSSLLVPIPSLQILEYVQHIPAEKTTTIETITEFLMVLMVIKENVLVLMETLMVRVSLYW